MYLQALTGPISRGDEGTVAAHLDCVKRLDRLDTLDVYCSLGKAATRLAERHPMPISAESGRRIRELLDKARS
jgi:predicted short-subunit dehydrogenase-like oxidoreductase (DUF2520 family)